MLPTLPDADVQRVTACYLYGIVPAAESDRVTSMTGVLETRVECLAEGELAAFLSELQPEEVAAIHGDLTVDDPERAFQVIGPLVEAHARVVRTIFSAATVLPLRFGTLLPSRGAVADVLSGRVHDIATALQELGGRDEWELRVTWDPVAADRELESFSRGGGSPDAGNQVVTTPGRAYLERKRQERELRDARYMARNQIAQLLHERAGALAVSADVHQGSGLSSRSCGPELVLHAAYLVAREDTSIFARNIQHEFDRLAAFDVRGQLTGPWPPYTFAALRIGADE